MIGTVKRKRNVTPAEVISKGIELLGDKGENWIIGSLDDQYASYCMLGTLDKAANILHANNETLDEATVAVARAIPGVRLNNGYLLEDAEDKIPTFNDNLAGRHAGVDKDYFFEDKANKRRHEASFKKVKRVMCKALKKELSKKVIKKGKTKRRK